MILILPLTRAEMSELRTAKGIVLGTMLGLLFWLIIYLLWPDQGPLLVNNPCAPYQQVMKDGILIDCTHPEQSPINMPIPKDAVLTTRSQDDG